VHATCDPQTAPQRPPGASGRSPNAPMTAALAQVFGWALARLPNIRAPLGVALRMGYPAFGLRLGQAGHARAA
jgi:hypothetical protein